MKRTLIQTAFLSAALCGLAYGNDTVIDSLTPDTTEMTAELDAESIPGLNPSNEVDAAAKIVASEVTEDSPLVRPHDIPIIPPKLVLNDSGDLVLVQYTAQNQRSARDIQAAPSSEIPQPYQNFNNLSNAERLSVLKKSIEAALVANARRGVNTKQHTPADVITMALPYGADARVYLPDPNANPRDRNAPRGNYIYSMGALCWNMPCNGKTLLRSDGNKVIAKVGHGYQQRPGSLAALMAMSHITPSYEVKLGENALTIAHLIVSERAAIAKGMNMSMPLVAFSFYGSASDQWKNELNEVWDIEKMVASELNRTIDQSTNDVTDWLLGLSSAVHAYESESKPIRGPLALAKRQLTTYHEFVLSIQNDRYLWHPKFFLYKGFHPDTFETMYSSGHILRWLVYSLPDKDLLDERVMRAVYSLNMTVSQVKAETMANSLTSRQLEGLGVSLHALALYHDRVFGEETEGEANGETSGAVASR